MKKSLVAFLFITGLLLGTAGSAFATAIITNATGGSAISADTAGTGGTGAYTTLTGPVLVEGANRDVGAGALVLNAPAGFQFDPAATVTATVTTVGGSGAALILSTPTATVTATSISNNVSTQDASGSRTSRITWSGIRVRPTAGTPLCDE